MASGRTRNDAKGPAAACERVLAAALMALSPPVNLVMTMALRRTARRQRGVFERLGPFQSAVFLIAPAELPVAFQLRPHPVDGRVRVVPRNADEATARIAGPLAELLGLFDGSLDADAVFFARSIEVAGDTSAVMALHNALEAADLTLADLVHAPAFAAGAVNRGLEIVLRARRAFLERG